MPRQPRFAFLFLFLLTPLLAQNGDRRGEVEAPPPATLKIPPAPALSPAEELATFKITPGFHVEAVATDPLLGDPVAIEFGPDGRLWVLEMRGFMPDVDGANERAPVCDVAVLEDTDGDGHYDKRTVFLDGLVLPRAICLVGDGLLVAEPTHLWFCRDTNGDGVCDQKTEIASDYGNINNPEHNANGLMWAMDNWIYSANYTGRFRYDGGGKFTRDATITRGQWGITQDDTGRIFYNSNSDPLRADLIASAYLKRNPNFSGAGANVAMAPANLRVWPGRVTPGINRGYNTLDTEGKMYAVTAACGPVIYRGALFPAEFRGDAFIAEPAGNLIKRIKLSEDGGTLHGANAYEGTEFLTSTDERFRPVNLFNGPDGALYVVDMYRGVIQHRIYVTTFLRKQIEERHLEQPRARGRIWRIVPDGAPKPDFKLGLAKASSAELVQELGDANGWTRDTAQRLLVERRDPAAIAPLRRMAVDAAQPALARLQALWTLDGAGALDRPTVDTALDDPDGRVAAAAVRLAEDFITNAPVGTGAEASVGPGQPPRSDPDLVAHLAALTTRRHEPAVRLQLALTLPEAHSESADQALRELVIAAGRQPYLADAVVSGIAGREFNLIASVARDAAATAAGETVRFATSSVLKSSDAARIDQVLALLTDPATQPWARRQLLEGVRYFLPKAESRGAFAGMAGGRSGPAGAGRGRGPGGPAGGAGRRGGGGRSAEPRIFIGSLPAEPKPLVTLAAQKNDPNAATAADLLKYLKWPGKPGMAVAARPLTPDEQALFEKGRAQFATLCATCHQPNGQGLAGLAPSLLYSRWVLGDPRVLARIVLCGKITENLSMPPWKAALNDEAIAGVLTFIRRSWGQDADPVTVATVAEARADTAKRDTPWSDADLEEFVQSLEPAPKPAAAK
jgi:glucose/arabinose dehydrogenase/mono/diheme cytochrome c family protein